MRETHGQTGGFISAQVDHIILAAKLCSLRTVLERPLLCRAAPVMHYCQSNVSYITLSNFSRRLRPDVNVMTVQRCHVTLSERQY